MFRKDFAAIALVLTATQAGAEPLTATRYADFDRYVLALLANRILSEHV